MQDYVEIDGLSDGISIDTSNALEAAPSVGKALENACLLRRVPRKVLDNASDSPNPTLGRRPYYWEPYKYLLGALDLCLGISFRRSKGRRTPKWGCGQV